MGSTSALISGIAQGSTLDREFLRELQEALPEPLEIDMNPRHDLFDFLAALFPHDAASMREDAE